MTGHKRILIGLALAASAAHAATAQPSTRGQPKTPFAVSDFAKLRWLEGSWAGTSDGGRSIFERCRFVDDTTIDITYYTDSAFTHETGNGRLYLSVGRVFHTMGPGRWGATNIDAGGAYFVPQSNTQSSLAWSRQSNDEWTATMRSGFVGRDRITVYHMRRAQR
jgi:hypothetical protein